VVSVVEPLMTIVPPNSAWFLAEPDLGTAVRAQSGGAVDAVVTRLRESGLDVAGDTVVGRPGTVLVDEARTFGADLLVAGSRGRGPIASLVLGSVSAELAVHAPCPVLIARRPHLSRVLFATDGSACALNAEELLARWPVLAHGAIRIVSVGELVRPWSTGFAPTIYSRVAAAYARDAAILKTAHHGIGEESASRLRDAGLAPDVAARVGDAAAEIVAEAREWGADTILVGSHGRSGLSHFLGSVARNVLVGSDASVLVAPLPR
jgi:nucleotide-binding universal stress UspA family protein